MKNNSLLIAVVVLVGLGALWFFTRDAQPSAGVTTLSVRAPEQAAITEVHITVPGKETKAEGAPTEGAIAAPSVREPGKTVIVKRVGEGFTVADGAAADKAFPADKGLVSSLFEAIADFKAGDRIATKKEKHADLEITDEAALRVKVNGGDFDLLFGRAAKDGGVTVRRQGQGDVFVSSTRIPTLAKKDLAAWRTKSLFEGGTLKGDDITGVTIARADVDPVVLSATTTEVPMPSGEEAEKVATKKSTTWSITTPASLPEGYRLDVQSLSRVAASFASLRAVDFADGVGDDVAGLAGPHTTITATRTTGAPLVLHLGNTNDKGNVYARKDGDAQLYLLPAYGVKNVDKGLDDFRDLSLLNAELGDITEVTFTSGGTRIVVAKDGDGWKRVAPKAAPADFDDGQINNVVGALTRLKGSRFVGAEGAAALAKSAVTVQVKTAAGVQTVRFGAAPAEGSDVKDVMVLGADGYVYATSPWARTRYAEPVGLFKKPPAPPPGMGGMGGPGGLGGIQGLENLPPDVRKKLEASLRQQQGG